MSNHSARELKASAGRTAARGSASGCVQRSRAGADENAVFRHEDIVRGIEASRVKDLIVRGILGAKHVYRVIPERTFSRRLAKGEALRMAEGDAIGRLVRVTNAARRTFGESGFADRWLNTANPALSDQIPIEMAATDAGAREVETVLSRIAYGDYS